MAHQPSSSSQTLFPQLETKTVPLDGSESYKTIIRIEKELVTHLKSTITDIDPLDGVGDRSIFPTELLTGSKKTPKLKTDPLNRLKDLSTEEVDDEEEPADEEEEDEETAVVDDEEDDAGGDYVVSHFDNGEGYEDNDDDGDEMTSMI